MKQKCKLLIISMLVISLLVPVFSSMGTSQAAGPYVLKVNKGTNVVTVYQNGTAIKAFVCSTGTATPIGTFNTSQKLNWHILQGDVYGQYCTRITGSILFHSVYYLQRYNKASQSYSAYNRLGTTASAGCVRLTVADAKWVYDNCPLSTTVVIFYGNSSNDPLGKPTAMKVSGSQGWDPTDPDPANPYSAKNPTITYHGSKDINVHSGFDPKAALSAKDSAGNDITGNVSVSGSVDTSKLGTYTVNYAVTDAIGRSASLSVTFNVVDNNKPVFSGIMKDKKVEYGTKLNIKNNVKAKSYAGKSLTSKIKVTIKVPGSSPKTYKKSVVNFVKLGTYRIKYTVTNPQNGKTTNKTLKIQVVDTKRPTLTNVGKNKKVQYGTKVNIRSGVRAKAATGANLTSKIVISVKAPGGSKYKTFKNKTYTFNKLGKYYVNYKVTNPRNNKSASAQMMVNVVDTKKPEITNLPANQTVEYKTTLDLVSKVKATAATGVNVKSNMKVYIKAPGSDYVLFKKQKYTFSKLGSYAVRYEATNPQNKKTKIQKRTITVVDSKVPTLSGVMADKQVEYKSVLDMKAGVTAKSAAAENLTANIAVTMKKPSASKYTAITANKVTFDEIGTYAFKYTIVNPKNNKSASKTVKITVVDSSEPVISGVPAGESYNQNDTLNILTGITASTTAGSADLTSQVAVTVTSPSGVAVTPNAGEISLTEVGTYQVVYQVTYNLKTATVTRDITVN